MYVFDPGNADCLEAVTISRAELIDRIPDMKIQFRLIEKPEDACVYVPDKIVVDEGDYQKYEKIIPKGVELYDGEKKPDYVIVIGDGEVLLKTARMFQKMDTPPILSIAYGEDPINFNFGLGEMADLFPIYIDELIQKNLSTQELMKLQVTNP